MRVVVATVLSMLVPVALGAQARATHPPEFWLGIVERGLVLPEGEQALPLLLELQRFFGHRDARLRDGAGYGITARWVVREKRLTDNEMRRLVAAWRAGLGATADPHGGDATLYRSFSALGLSLVAARDVEQKALDAATVSALVDAAAAQLDANTDVRGYDAEIGWVHVTAHTADLLKFLGRHAALPRERQATILTAVARRAATSPTVFAWGEGERLSRAAASVLRRDDVDVAAVDTFLDALLVAARRVDWDRPVDASAVATHENAKGILKDLHLVLSVAGKDDLRQRVLARLEKLP